MKAATAVEKRVRMVRSPAGSSDLEHLCTGYTYFVYLCAEFGATSTEAEAVGW